MQRIVIMKAHALLAAFILPVALMFGLTGSLYTWGTKGSYENTAYEVALDVPLTADLAALTSLAEAELQARQISLPEGRPRLKSIGSSFMLEWTGSSKDLILEPSREPNMATLTVKNTSWYRSFVQLHKAKGGTPFKVYAALFALALGALLVSGFIMAWQTPRLKAVTLGSALTGMLSFVLVYILS